MASIPQFSGCSALLATMHGKELVIAPILLDTLQLQVTVPDGFNTDVFGTFTRDIPRIGDQLQTARAKINAVLAQFGGDIAIASEGSVGPHPLLPMVPYNHEIVLFVDRRYELEVMGEAIATDTNFSHRSVETYDQALAFAQEIGFPDHGLIAMPHAEVQQPTDIIKGITTETQLQQALSQCQERSSQRTVHLETDMRAMHNPMRMKVITAATWDLVQKLTSHCPSCQWPNFTISEQKPGLPCRWCGAPTDLIRSVVYHCQHCGLNQETLFQNGQDTADPGQCSYCNP